MTPNVEFVFETIKLLTVEERAELYRLLRGEDEGGIGVREPRRPAPESPGDAIVNPIPEGLLEGS
jgi:hypothetical protein